MICCCIDHMYKRIPCRTEVCKGKRTCGSDARPSISLCEICQGMLGQFRRPDYSTNASLPLHDQHLVTHLQSASRINAEPAIKRGTNQLTSRCELQGILTRTAFA